MHFMNNERQCKLSQHAYVVQYYSACITKIMLKSVEVNNSHVVVVDLLNASHSIRVYIRTDVDTFEKKKNCLHFIAIFVITSTS